MVLIKVMFLQMRASGPWCQNLLEMATDPYYQPLQSVHLSITTLMPEPFGLGPSSSFDQGEPLPVY